MERVSILTSFILLLASPLLAVTTSQYGLPSSSLSSSFTGNNFNSNQDAGGYQNFRNNLPSTGSLEGNTFGSNISGPKTFRHISLFVAPQEQDDQPRVRTIRPQGSSDKHVQIIFVKAPSTSSQQTTEVILPEQPSLKTLVYVLVKKQSDSMNNIKIRGPPPTNKPPPPEVYFIKYKGGNTESSGGYSGGQNSNGGGVSFNGGASSNSLSTSYGIP